MPKITNRLTILAALVAAIVVPTSVVGQESLTVASAPVAVAVGPSGLPVPRFVTLKASRVNVRVGPGENYAIAWIFTRPGLPVEVIQEYDNWRRIRDSDGQMGWVFQSLLSGKRAAVISPWERGTPLPITAGPTEDAKVTAFLEPGVLAEIEGCDAGWCRLSEERFAGWIRQDRLWGVYPEEVLD